MAHPFYLIDDALRCFYRQWNSGLQPKLSLLTHSDGSIMISTEVDSQISDYDPSSHAHKTSVGDSSSHRRRSGRNSRIRRRYLRSKDQVNVSENARQPAHTQKVMLLNSTIFTSYKCQMMLDERINLKKMALINYNNCCGVRAIEYCSLDSTASLH